MRTAIQLVMSSLFAVMLVCAPAAHGARPSLDDPKYLVTPWAGEPIEVPTLEAIAKQFSSQLNVKDHQSLCSLLFLMISYTCPPDEKTARSRVSASINSSDMRPQEVPMNTRQVDIAQEIAAFLAERAQLELKAWVLERLLADLCPSQPAGESYFPRVCKAGDAKDPYALLRMEAELVRAARRDLTELPAYAIWRGSAAAEGDRQAWGYIVTNLAIQTREGASLRALLAGLAAMQPVQDDCSLRKLCALYYVGLMAHTYQAIELVIETDIKQTCERRSATDPKTTPKDRARCAGSLAIRLLYVHLCEGGKCVADTSIWLDKAEALAALIVKAAADDRTALQWIEQVRKVRAQTNAVEAETKRLEDLKRKPGTPEELADGLSRLLGAGGELGDRLLNMLGAPEDKFLKIDAWQGYLHLFQSLTKTAAAFEAGHYSTGIGETRELVRCLNRNNTCTPELPFQVTNPDLLKALDGVTRNVALVATIADAKSSAQVQAALNEWASPLGSWRLKRDRSVWSVGAIVGGAVANEYLRGGGVTTSGYVMSAFAPVGIDASCPFLTSSTIGLFVSVVDFGNLVSTRLTGNSSDEVQSTSSSTKFRDIASPGVFLRFGLGRSPWVLAFGVAYTPELRTTKLKSGEEVKASSTRVTLGLGMDIPLLFF